MHNWQRAIPLGVHLWQAAGLIARRHEEEVAPTHQQVLDLRVKAYIAAHPALVGVLCPPQRVGVLLLAIAHHDNLAAACHAIPRILHEPIDDLHHDVDALLPSQAAHEADKHNFGVLEEAKLLLDRSLVRGLASDEVVDRVLRVQVLVGLRVPHVIDAVQDAAQPERIALGADEVFQTKATLRCLDLFRVVGGHRQDAVRIDDSRLRQVDAVAERQIRGHVLLAAEEVAC
mmetsp:Transcript_60060/g.168360  ORF Transcript_60060/g.168360 Transcript_60060/m.168360 type:complete len:230 (+) Transcript_60060:550-1239(+)